MSFFPTSVLKKFLSEFPAEVMVKHSSKVNRTDISDLEYELKR